MYKISIEMPPFLDFKFSITSMALTRGLAHPIFMYDVVMKSVKVEGKDDKSASFCVMHK